jgi:hypothetical protein
MLLAASTTHAQLMTVTKRHRIKADFVKPQEFGREQRQQIGQQRQRKKSINLRNLEGDMSMPLEEMPIIPPFLEMSMPQFELSMSIESIEKEKMVAMTIQLFWQVSSRVYRY